MVDRFARLRGKDPRSGPSPDDSERFPLTLPLESGTVLAAGATGSDDDDEAGEG
jgi:hypothetical protein